MSSSNKLQKFAENLTFPNLFQYPFLHKEDCQMRGRWHSGYFKNDLPVVIEIGCGKGEYTIGLAERYPNKNFIGIDIKGACDGHGCFAFFNGYYDFISDK